MEPSNARRTVFHTYEVAAPNVTAAKAALLHTAMSNAIGDLNTFTSGAQVRVHVSALNMIGESQPREVVEHTAA